MQAAFRDRAFSDNKKGGLRRLFPDYGLGYAEKEDPQPQVDFALGFLITNCSP